MTLKSCNLLKRTFHKILSERQMRLAKLLRDYLSLMPLLLWQEFKLISRAIQYRHFSSPANGVLLSLLRTAAHVVDKGLQTEPWELGRGNQAYENCVRLVERLKESNLASDPSYRWAVRVVRNYEQAQARKSPGTLSTPMPDLDEEHRAFFLKLLKSRRSVRSFQCHDIEVEVMRQIAQAANWAPSSCCRQPVFLYVATEPQLVKDCMNQCAGATGFTDCVPCFISVCADMRTYETVDRHLPLIDVGLGVQNLLLVAHAFGVEGTILNWMHATQKEEKSLRRLLDIRDYHCVALNIVMGYPKNVSLAPGRKGLDLTYVMREATRSGEKAALR